FEPEEAMRPGAPQLHDEANNIREPKRVRIGDIDTGLKEAELVVKGRYHTTKQAHVCLDTHGCISSYDPAAGKLTHWTTAQSIFWTRLSLAEALDMPASRIRVITPEAIGGGFGSKSGTFAYDICAALMSKRLGKPVKMALSREQEFLATRSRHPFIIEAEAGLRRDGTIVAWRQRTVLDMGGYADLSPRVAMYSQAMAQGPYKVPNIWIDSYPVYTNKSISAAFRGFGNPQATFARESLIDMAAEQLGIDPLELRLKNIIKPEDLPYTTSTGFVIRSCGVEECLRKAAGAVEWGKRRKPNAGAGLACMITWGGGAKTGDADFGAAQVEVAADGSVVVRTGNTDIGQGLYTVLAQIAAEELGVPMELVTVVGADSEVTPPDIGCFASKSALVTGSAVKRAAGEAREKLFRVAGNMLEVDPQDLVARHGRIHVKDMSRSLDIKEVANAAYFTSVAGDAGPIIGQGLWVSQTEHQSEDGYGDFVPAYGFGAAAAEVEVNPETGEVKITRYATVHDGGRILNVSIMEGQLHGAASMGISYGLFEQGLVYDREGRLLNPSILDYKVPTAADLPDILSASVETIDPAIPLGNKGSGESALITAAAAIANAIYHAVGVRITELPITPGRILRALEEKKGKASA
ncbi:MAG: molybdopterin-dependent oxidoreductase, partial [Chloroflexi bacterium]|nr:molybdopterin-dependent oxidoreductase [Chloroflexota bacterium]